MHHIPYTRRHFLRDGALLGLTLPFFTSKSLSTPVLPASPLSTPEVRLDWLEQQPPDNIAGITWGVPWPQGTLPADSHFILKDRQQDYAIQSWPLAYWPDGSLKWSAHALGGKRIPEGPLRLQPSSLRQQAPPLAKETETGWVINTGVIKAVITRNHPAIISEIWQGDRLALCDGRLVLHTRQGEYEEAGAYSIDQLTGAIDSLELEQNGPQRAVITVRGQHRQADKSLMPFIVRLYWYAGTGSVRIMHTLIYDNDQSDRAIAGIGLAFDAPQRAALHDRHIRFVSDQQGVFSEAVRGLTGLRRDPGRAVIAAQTQGKATPPLSTFTPIVAQRLETIPSFGQYRLLQHHPDGYHIHKRTAARQAWILSATGNRAAGVGYLGSAQGGIAFGIRNFWQSYPAALDISRANTDLATVTLWLWSPWAETMDMRSWHDGQGLQDFSAQRAALDITYEDYEPGFDSPIGVARTSEMVIELLSHTPNNAQLASIAQRIQSPPLLVAPSETLWHANVFGPVWIPANQINPQHRPIADQLAWYFDFYRQEVEQRKWYGFWDFGDVMHTYDSDRHVWRYDVGGYAWDNSELSTDLWLWYYFLHSGRADVFRMAEAMTRHTGEVDVHHLGPFAPLGSRHNVRHWGDSAKQLRISTVANRRFLYYLTADERIGELMDAQIEGVRTLQSVPPGRKIGQPAARDAEHVSLYFGTDWGAVAAAWLTAWERYHDDTMRQRLLNSMQSIAAQPHGFFTGLAEMHITQGRFEPAPNNQLFISHLSAVFGLAEICSELMQLIPDPSFATAWLEYCRLYNDLPALSRSVGKTINKLNLVQGHSRLTAFAAWHDDNSSLAQRAWGEFTRGEGGIAHPNQQQRIIRPPEVLYPIREAAIDSAIDKQSGSTADTNLATNAVAQWGLTALSLLALLNTSSLK